MKTQKPKSSLVARKRAPHRQPGAQKPVAPNVKSPKPEVKPASTGFVATKPPLTSANSAKVEKSATKV